MANRDRALTNPVREISRLQRNIDRMFDEIMPSSISGNWPESGESTWDFHPAMDVQEDEKQFVLSFDLPGVKREDVKIEMRGNTLFISGERKEEHEEKRKNRQYTEKFYGSFHRAFTLPTNVKLEQIQAHYDNGVLEIALPKEQISQTKQIEIKSGSRTEIPHHKKTA